MTKPKDEEKSRSSSSDHQPQYGTFQGVANYPPPPPPPPPQTTTGFPQPVPPPGSSEPSAPPQYYAPGYQAVPGYAVVEGRPVEGRPVRERHLPCCGLGCGWCLFIIGFFLGTIPWYIGLILLMCGRFDYREKPGYVACAIAAVIATVVIVLGATKGAHDW